MLYLKRSIALLTICLIFSRLNMFLFRTKITSFQV